MESLFLSFVETWLLGLIAILVGRYIGPGNAQFPKGVGRILFAYLKVWALTFFARVSFNFLGHSLHWDESAQSAFADFMLPVAAGAYFARQLLRLETQRDKQ